MASTSEVGHAKNVANLQTLTTTCAGFGTKYNPTNPNLTIPVLKTVHTQAKAVLKSLKKEETTFNDIEGQRILLFKPIKSLATQVVGALRSSGASVTVIKDAETINRKIQGKRAENAPIEEAKDGEKPKKRVSVSQLSYDMQIDHLEKLIELVGFETKYAPNEEPLQVESLTAVVASLETINSAVKDASVPYNNALMARDKTLYDPETGLVATTQLVKNYVKSVFKASSPEFKLVNSINFRSRKA